MAISAMACGQPRPVAEPATSVVDGPRLAVIPAESDVFPAAAKALSASLAGARIAGVDETQVTRVSLEVVQLSVECTEATSACYDAIGRAMKVNRLLFGRVDPDGKRQCRVTVTLYDVDRGLTVRKASRAFPSERDATSGVPALVAEVAR